MDAPNDQRNITISGEMRTITTTPQTGPTGAGEVGEALRPSILLAEDDHEMRALLGSSLRQAGFDVVECRNGIELLDRIEGYGPSNQPAAFDLIISDICMPGVSGLSLLEGLRQWEELQPLTMILITAFGDEQMRERARQFGAAAIFDKPFDLEDLLVTAREALNLVAGAYRDTDQPRGALDVRSER